MCSSESSGVDATHNNAGGEPVNRREEQMTSQKIARGMIIATAVVLCVQEVVANGFRNPPSGAAALGRVGGRIAQLDDVSSLVINPANVADLEGTSVQASYMVVHSDAEFSSPDGRSADTRDKDKHIPSLFGATRIDGDHPLVVGVAVSSPWGQSTVWPKDATFLGTVPHFAELITVRFSPTVATRFGERLRVGAAVDLIHSELDLRQRLALLGPGHGCTAVRRRPGSRGQCRGQSRRGGRPGPGRDVPLTGGDRI